MSGLPREPGFDSSLALLRAGYRFIGNRCRRFGTDVFEVTPWGHPVAPVKES